MIEAIPDITESYFPKDDFTLKNSRHAVYVYNLSDWHLGTNLCNLPYIKHMLKEMDDLKGIIIINILGDLFDCADLHVGDSAFEQEWSVNQQLRECRKLLYKIIKKPNVFLRFVAPGNHEARLRRLNFDLMEHFVEMLGGYYTAPDMELKKIGDESDFVARGTFIDKFWINGKPLEIFGRHGNGKAKRLDLAMAKQGRETTKKRADIYVEGHNHRCHHYSEIVQVSKIDGGIKREYYGFTGHFINYPGGYADKMGLDILPEAFLRFSIKDINGKLQIEGKEFHIDRQRPDLFKI